MLQVLLLAMHLAAGAAGVDGQAVVVGGPTKMPRVVSQHQERAVRVVLSHQA